MSNGAPNNHPLVSVVVISKDEPQLDETLTLLARECETVGGECIVVDASEGRLDWISEKHPGVRWIAYPTPIDGRSSIPQQRNTGVRAARGSVIAFCDSGGEPCEGWLKLLVAPLLAGVQRYTCGPVRSTRPGVYRVINDVADGEVSESPPTANVAFTAELFHEVGGFDGRYAYGSDVDFAWRCAEAGAAPVCVAAAVMGMDWGPWQLQKRRSWRYGRARARLGRHHPKRRWRILRDQPEIVAYPAITAGTVAGLIGVLSGRRGAGGAVVAGMGAAAAALRWRGRRNEQPGAVMLGHVIYGWAYWFERIFGPRGWRVVARHTPVDDGPYVRALVQGLEEAGVSAAAGSGMTHSATLNVLLAPVEVLWWRVRGVRIWHLHWTWGWVPAWAEQRAVRRIMRWWFVLQLHWAKRLGMKIVWTAHNLYPHQPVFDDDRAARVELIKRCDLVIAHTEEAARRVRDAFGVEAAIIDQGPIEVPAVERDRARELLCIGDGTVLLGFGKVAPYKGFDLILDAAAGGELDRWTHEAEIRIVGEAEPWFRDMIEEKAARCRERGWTVTTVLEHVSEERLGMEISAADACVFPFRESLNSSTVRAAQRAGRYAIVAGHKNDLVQGCEPEVASVADAIEGALEMTRTERDGRGALWREGAQDASWSRCAEATREAYRVLLGGDGR